MAHTTDQTVLNHIEQLVAEEKTLYHKGEISDAEQQRLAAINVELDRYWDLLRQRRAHEEFGLDPSDTSMRDAGTVEGYEA